MYDKILIDLVYAYLTLIGRINHLLPLLIWRHKRQITLHDSPPPPCPPCFQFPFSRVLRNNPRIMFASASINTINSSTPSTTLLFIAYTNDVFFPRSSVNRYNYIPRFDTDPKRIFKYQTSAAKNPKFKSQRADKTINMRFLRKFIRTTRNFLARRLLNYMNKQPSIQKLSQRISHFANSQKVKDENIIIAAGFS